MKTRFSAALARGGLLLLVAASALLWNGRALAEGTLAGTVINNKATLSYSVGTVNQANIASSPGGSTDGVGANTSFTVDKKINLTVTTSDGPTAVAAIPNQADVITTFVVSNTGNSTQSYALTVNNLADGAQTVFSGSLTDNFDVTTASCKLRVGGVEQGYVGNLSPDGSATVEVLCPIPAALANASVAVVSLVAQAATAGSNGATLEVATVGANTAGMDVVFADNDGIDDGLRDATSSARSAYQIVTAALTLQKQVALVCDPLNGDTNPKNIPGAYARYTVTITNNGSASATLGTITDALDANVEFDANLIQGTGAGANCGTGGTPTSAAGTGFRLDYTNRGAGYTPKYMTTGANADGATHAGGTITINFAEALPAAGAFAAGELKQGQSLSLQYQVRIK